MRSTDTPVIDKAPLGSGPRRRVLLGLVLTVLVAHAALLIGTGSHLLSGAPGLGKTPVGQTMPQTPLKTRLLTPQATPAPTRTETPTARASAVTHSSRPSARFMPAQPPQPRTAPPQDLLATEALTEDTGVQSAASEAQVDTARAASAVPETSPASAVQSLPVATLPTPNATAPEGPRPPADPLTSATLSPATALSPPVNEASGAGAAKSAPAEPVAAGQGLPLRVSSANLPPPVLLSYDMTGMDKGLRYHASGELQWQHDGRRYALTLSVKAFLVGSRHWRSRGSIGPDGLEPARFSDTRRSEQAAHFDRAGQRVVFSNNAPAAPLQAGAQDQISLYVQLATAMNGQPDAFAVGRQVLLQTATVRDALPWQLTLEQQEVLQVAGQPVSTFKWVCLPRQRFDSRIEFWSSPQHHGLPARIRITQASGSYIDMQLRSLQPLAALAVEPGLGEKTTSP